MSSGSGGGRAYLGQSGVVDERDTEVDGVSARDVVLVERVPSSLSGKVDDRLDLVLLEDLVQLALVCGKGKDGV